MKTVVAYAWCASGALILAACSGTNGNTSSPGEDAGAERDAGAPVAEAGARAGDASGPSEDASTPARDAAGSGGDAALTDGGDCSAARAQLLGSIDTVATGSVSVLTTTAETTTLYVDASAGGISDGASNPWIFVNLGTGTKTTVTDKTSIASRAWDLAFKRPVLYTNDGDGGPGVGGAVLISKDFDSVTSSDTAGATFLTESFFDAQCAPKTDPTGAVLTTFSTWYDYDQTTHILTPAAGTWLVRGGTGSLYKLQIVSYYANPDGGIGTGNGGTYVLKVGAL